MEQFVVDQQHTMFANDALLTTQSLTSITNTPAEILAKFALVSYNKGRPTDFLETLSTITKSFLLFLIFIINNPFAVTVLTLKIS
jgi:hypothetical protein